jgi:hypothetical protein
MATTKWEGYPDSDNMWVDKDDILADKDDVLADKDDILADNKVREFKASNPEAEVHIRGLLSAKSPHPSAPTRSQLLYNHALYHMSSDGNNKLAFEYPAGAVADSPIPFSQENSNTAPVCISTVPIVDFTTMQTLSPGAPVFSPRPVTASSSASDVATMFRQLRVHTPAPLTPDGQCAADQAAETFNLSLTPAGRGGNEAGSSLAPDSAAGSVAPLGGMPTALGLRWLNSYDSATNNDF